MDGYHLQQIFSRKLFPVSGYRKGADQDWMDLALEEGGELWQHVTSSIPHPDSALCACIHVLAELTMLQDDTFKRRGLIDAVGRAIQELADYFEKEGPETEDEGDEEGDGEGEDEGREPEVESPEEGPEEEPEEGPEPETEETEEQVAKGKKIAFGPGGVDEGPEGAESSEGNPVRRAGFRSRRGGAGK